MRRVAAPIADPSRVYKCTFVRILREPVLRHPVSMSSFPQSRPSRSNRRRAALAALARMGRLGMAGYLGALYGSGVPYDRNGERKDDQLRYLPDSRR
jgi:hypothetical protein